jgi:acetoin utilization protein AcuB
MKAHEVMNQNVIVLDPNASVDDACDLMFDRDIRHVPIVSDGIVVGIVSDRDIRCYLAEMFGEVSDDVGSEQKKKTELNDVMQAKPISVQPDADVQDVIEAMLEWKVGAVLVCEPTERLRGIISYEDILEVVRDLSAL